MPRRIGRFLLTGILAAPLGEAQARSWISATVPPRANGERAALYSLGTVPPGALYPSGAMGSSAAPAAERPAPPIPRRSLDNDPEPVPARRSFRETGAPMIVPLPRPTRANRRGYRILRARPERTDRYDDLILENAERFGLDARLMKAIIAAESEFHLRARSPAGAVGLMQLMPATAELYGVSGPELFVPARNVRAGAAYLDYLFRRARRELSLAGTRNRDMPLWAIERIAAAYNAGPNYLSQTRWPEQTRFYVWKVLLFYQYGVSDLRRPPRPAFTAPDLSARPPSARLYQPGR